jgi:type IV secretion system protein VirB10
VLDAQAVLEAQARAADAAQTQRSLPDAPRSGGTEDTLAADRRRKEYESLFASNVVMSRRPETQRPDAGARTSSAGTPARVGDGSSLDEIADAVVRATTRAGMPIAATMAPVTAPTPTANQPPSLSATGGRPGTPDQTGPINPTDPRQRILEGTFVDTVLTNRLEGSLSAPVNCLVTNPVYSHSGQHVVIPAGARLLGETRPVQSLGETRLAVAFHRLLMPDGRTYSLDQFLGLNQIGDAGLKDRVNQHYWSTFGTAGAVGLISGLAQWVGTAGLSAGTGDRTVIIAGGADAASQASLQVMNRLLNRLPTIEIREGHRVKVYVTSDLELPVYDARETAARN